MIELTPYSKERFVEIFESMRAPQLVVATFTGERGTTLFLNNKGGIVQYKFFIEDEADYRWIEEQLHKHLDPHADLKRAYKEGAELELLMREAGNIWVPCPVDPPAFDRRNEYRIKSGITIAQWDKHKDAIKAWWQGEPIELKGTYDNAAWFTPARQSDITWRSDHEYRVGLKPCPFCGGEAELSEFTELSTAEEKRYDITCRRCEASFNTVFDTETDARQAWNRRA